MGGEELDLDRREPLPMRHHLSDRPCLFAVSALAASEAAAPDGLRPSKREPAKITRSRNGSGAGACEREACGSQRRGRLTRGQPSQEARAAPQQGPHVPTAL
jgi:hypothetical protein